MGRRDAKFLQSPPQGLLKGSKWTGDALYAVKLTSAASINGSSILLPKARQWVYVRQLLMLITVCSKLDPFVVSGNGRPDTAR